MSSLNPSHAYNPAAETSAYPPWRMWTAAWIVTAVFILSNSATPLYVRWQAAIGFSSATLTVIFAAYILGLLLTLLVAGQLSDRFGRRPVLLPGLAAAIVACLLFATAQSVPMLIAARFLSGVAVGVVVSAGMAAVVDIGGPDRKRQASLIASVSMVLGAGLGPLLAGGIALSLAKPVVPIFAIELVILLTAVLVVLLLPLKHRGTRADHGWRLHLPRVPHANHRHLLFGIAVFGPGITATSFVLALGPSLLSHLLGVTSPLIAGGMACAMFLTATGVQFAAREFSVRTIFLCGAAATVLSMAGIALALLASNAIALIVAALLAGSGQGLGQLGGLTLIGLHVPGSHRAEANAVLNIGGYIPAGLMPVATGLVIDWAGLSLGAMLFTAMLAMIAVLGGATVFRKLAKD
ncbi:MFS transporter [Rhodopseudomonas sp.]|uniref:MFS transporter n=1 Tax=Rhodopseudomonas sp. TaxID=1078 RepID=UPI0039E452CC